MLEILFISPRYEGGIGGHAFRVAEKLREHGFHVTLFHVPHIPIKNLKNPSFSIFGLFKALINNKQYDAVHAFNLPSGIIMKYIKAKKKILSVHGVYSDQINMLHSSSAGRASQIAESKVLTWADKITTDSKMVQTQYRKKLGLDIIHLPAPLDTDKFKNIPNVPKKEKQIIYIGRDSYEKGIDILKKIESKINGHVVYCTNIPWEETMKILKSSSLLVLPSRIESLPQVIKEAFYLKIPVVAFNVGGVSEIIIDGVNGILVPPNDKEKLLVSVNKLLDDKDLLDKFSNTGYKHIQENYTWDVLLPKYMELYEN